MEYVIRDMDKVRVLHFWKNSLYKEYRGHGIGTAMMKEILTR